MKLCDTTTEGERLAVLATLKACYALRISAYDIKLNDIGPSYYCGLEDGINSYANLIQEAIQEMEKR